MFSVHCPRHGARVLLSSRSIVGVAKRAEGIEVRWRCTCDEEGSTVIAAAPGVRS